MFRRIEGQRLHLAKMSLANYCISMERQAGQVNIQYVVRNINKEFSLVSPQDVEALVSDVNHFYECLINQQVESIDRDSYWKFKAISLFEAKQNLIAELGALKA